MVAKLTDQKLFFKHFQDMLEGFAENWADDWKSIMSFD
jgi:hypothetical protein